MAYTPRPCHRTGCPNDKRRGRSFHYCSDECARATHLEVRRAKSGAWRDGHRTELRAQQLWTRYRITVERFERMLEEQQGACAICQTLDPGGGSNQWHIDHDHQCCPGRKSCGECVRGLLCDRCNRHVLVVVEGPLLAPALAYLRRRSDG